MIVQRLSKGIKDQDWFVVGVEVLIVVLGIFIGLQVDDWNDARKGRALERDYLERLYSDFQFNQTQLNQLANLHGGISDDLYKVTRFLLSDTIDLDEQEAVNKIFLRYFVYPSPSLRMGTYEELVSTGRLALIQDDKIKIALQQADAGYKTVRGQLDYFRRPKDDIIPTDFMTLTMDDQNQIQTIMNYEKYHGNQSFIRPLIIAASAHRSFKSYRNREFELTSDVVKIIACAINKPECDQSK